ncbi:MAG: hypothetical protein ABMA14_18270 [Hyphomonadaceae bacterium]
MTLRALLLCGLLAGCSTLAPTPAQEIDSYSYAAADIAAIQKEADDLDIDQLHERMDAIRDANWNNAAPVIPAGAPVSLEMAISSSAWGVEVSLIAWRDTRGGWEWRSAKHAGGGLARAAPSEEITSGRAPAEKSAELDRQLASAERRAEIWYSPAATPLKDGGENRCHDGASNLLVIHRAGQPDETVVQSCQTRWLNGKLIDLISSLRD